jgi:hypothetical protein
MTHWPSLDQRKSCSRNIAELLEAVFSVRSILRLYNVEQLPYWTVLSWQLGSAVRNLQGREDCEVSCERDTKRGIRRSHGTDERIARGYIQESTQQQDKIELRAVHPCLPTNRYHSNKIHTWRVLSSGIQHRVICWQTGKIGDLIALSQDLNQLAAFQHELPRRLSGTGQTETIKNTEWESLTGLKQAKGFLQGPSVRRSKELLKLNRNQFRWVRTTHGTLSPERTPF